MKSAIHAHAHSLAVDVPGSTAGRAVARPLTWRDLTVVRMFAVPHYTISPGLLAFMAGLG